MARHIVSVLALALLAGCKSLARVSNDTISQSEALTSNAPDVQDETAGAPELKPNPDDVSQQLGATTDITDPGLSNSANSEDHGEAPSKTGLGPAWTRGEMEKPLGSRDMGGWTEAFYTSEQQMQLGVDEQGNPREEPEAQGQAKAPPAPEAPEADLLLLNYKVETPEEQQAPKAEAVEEAPPAQLPHLESAKQLCRLLGVHLASTSKALQHQISQTGASWQRHVSQNDLANTLQSCTGQVAKHFANTGLTLQRHVGHTAKHVANTGVTFQRLFGQTGKHLAKAARQHCTKEHLAIASAALQNSLQCFSWPAAAAAAATAASTVAAIAAAAEAAAATAAAKAAIEAASTVPAGEGLHLTRYLNQLIGTGAKFERLIIDKVSAIKSGAAERAQARKAAVKRYVANTTARIGRAGQQLASTGAQAGEQLWGKGTTLGHFLMQKATAAKAANAVRALAKKAAEEQEAAEKAAAAEEEKAGAAKTMRDEAKKAAAQRAAQAKTLSKRSDLQKELEERLAQLEVSFDYMLTICQVLVVSVVGVCLSQAFGAMFSWEAYKLSKSVAGFLGIGEQVIAPNIAPNVPDVREVREPRLPKPRFPTGGKRKQRLLPEVSTRGSVRDSVPASHFPSSTEIGHFKMG